TNRDPGFLLKAGVMLKRAVLLQGSPFFMAGVQSDRNNSQTESASVGKEHPVKIVVQILHSPSFCRLGQFEQQVLVFGESHGVTSRRCDGNASSLSPAYPSFCIGRAKSRV